GAIAAKPTFRSIDGLSIRFVEGEPRNTDAGATRACARRGGITSIDHDGLKGVGMSTIHLHQTTTSTPEQFLAALIDFGPGRSKLFGNSADGYLRVHYRGPSGADVTEGSGGICGRLQ